jgi:PIN domain nuclease of toxin-antitoxin system
VILLDTHVLVWLVEASTRLGTRTLKQIDRAILAGEVAVSAISFWEVGMLVTKGRIEMQMDLSVWRDALLEQGVLELPVTGEIGITAAGMEGFHGDPADRLIAATALKHSLTLITADAKLLDCKLSFECCDASK